MTWWCVAVVTVWFYISGVECDYNRSGLCDFAWGVDGRAGSYSVRPFPPPGRIDYRGWSVGKRMRRDTWRGQGRCRAGKCGKGKVRAWVQESACGCREGAERRKG